MRVLIVTQNEPFYLAKNLDYLFSSLPEDISVIGVCLSNPSPFGKKESFLKKSYKTFKIFGPKFFIFYTFQYFIKLFDKSKDVKKIVKKFNFKILKLKNSINSKESINQLSYLKPDLIISILGNEIFKKEIINLPKNGLLNLHSSLLPKYRGLMPTFWALKNDEKFTGVSLFLVDEGIDSGPIIIQRKIPIKNYNHRELIYLTKKIGMDLIISALDIIRSKEKIKYIKNCSKDMTYYSFPKRDDVKEFFKSGKRFF